VVKHVRQCGTTGCKLQDWHGGAHSTEKRPCRKIARPQHTTRKSPRFDSSIFPWCNLCEDLQALILLQLADNTVELCEELARLAIHLRQLRPTVIHAMELDDSLLMLMESGWSDTDTKIRRNASCLVGCFGGVHVNVPPSVQIEEEMHVSLHLRRPQQSPRRWQWVLGVSLRAVGTHAEEGPELASCELVVSLCAKVGIKPRVGSWRNHRIIETRESCMDAMRGKFHTQALSRLRYMSYHAPILVTMDEAKLALFTCIGPVFEWRVPPVALSILKLASAVTFTHRSRGIL
jgi:hypothetical protein